MRCDIPPGETTCNLCKAGGYQCVAVKHWHRPCTLCKRLRVRCDLPPSGETTCGRCKEGGYECDVQARKPPTTGEIRIPPFTPDAIADSDGVPSA